MHLDIHLQQDVLKRGIAPRTVQEIMGHANYNTTVSYTHVLDDIKLKEAELSLIHI